MDFEERERKEIERRLMAMTVESDDPRQEYNGMRCWNCTYSGTKGYAEISIKHKTFRAHRIAYWLWKGEIPEGLHVLHFCDNRACINPQHLFIGTNDDNIKDKCEKGRSPIGDKNGSRLHPEKLARGEKNGFAKLTEEHVRYIRMWRNEGFSHRSIAKAFNISISNVNNIVLRKSWKHIP